MKRPQVSITRRVGCCITTQIFGPPRTRWAIWVKAIRYGQTGTWVATGFATIYGNIMLLPVIKNSLAKVEATKYYSDIITKYNSFPTTFKKINPDLPGYVTEKATNALFDQISIEEKQMAF